MVCVQLTFFLCVHVLVLVLVWFAGPIDLASTEQEIGRPDEAARTSGAQR